MLTDEIKVVAARAAKQGVRVVSEQWEAMPHCFGLIFLGSPMSKRCFKDWTDFCKDIVEGKDITTKGTWFQAKSHKETEVDVANLTVMTEEEVKSRMQMAKESRHLGDEGEAKILPKL